MTIIKNDPYQGLKFTVEINGIIVGGFSEVSGLNAEIQVEEFKEGGINNHIHKLLKDTKYSNLVLKKGLTDSDKLWIWYQNTIAGKIERRNIYVSLLDKEGEVAWTWCFENAHPVKWISSEFKSDNNAIVLESLEFVHQGFKKI